MQGHPRIIPAGSVFGRLTVTKFVIRKQRGHLSCICVCGKRKTLRADGVLAGRTKSCGCLPRGPKVTVNCRSRTYLCWRGIIDRCYRPTHRLYKYYGGRGITVCARWRKSFKAFHEDMGDMPLGKSIDRWPNNDGPYKKKNCRWASRKQQQRNRRITPLLTYKGVTASLPEWTERTGLSYPVIYNRFQRYRWPAAKVLTTPVKLHRRRSA